MELSHYRFDELEGVEAAGRMAGFAVVEIAAGGDLGKAAAGGKSHGEVAVVDLPLVRPRRDYKVSTGELESDALGEKGDLVVELGGRQARLERRGKDCLPVEL
jgi:hypothetical protein